MKALAPLSLALAGLLTLSAGALGNTTAAAQPAQPAQSSRHSGACFWTRSVDNFAAPDDRHLYVRVGMRQVYELTLFSDCLDISWVHHLALRSRTSSDVCEGPNPDLDVVDRETGIGPQRCPVTFVRRLTPDQVAALPKDARP